MLGGSEHPGSDVKAKPDLAQNCSDQSKAKVKESVVKNFANENDLHRSCLSQAVHLTCDEIGKFLLL